MYIYIYIYIFIYIYIYYFYKYIFIYIYVYDALSGRRMYGGSNVIHKCWLITVYISVLAMMGKVGKYM